VLLVVKDDQTLEIGQPTVKNAQVNAKIVQQVLGPKVIAYKYKPKKRYHKKIGHRQKLTEVEITNISL